MRSLGQQAVQWLTALASPSASPAGQPAPVPWPALELMMPQLWLALERCYPLDEICSAAVDTWDFIEAGLLLKAERAFSQCLAGVVQHNCRDGWVHCGAAQPSCRARLAWTELWLCLATCPERRPKRQRTTTSWRTVWTAGSLASGASSGMRWLVLAPGDMTDHSRSLPRTRQLCLQEEAVFLAQRGLPGQAVERLGSFGVAPDTPHTRRAS